MTALTAFLTNSATTTTLSSTANQISSATPGPGTTITTKVGKSSQWIELLSRGTNSTQTGVASIGTPTGNGWIWDVTTLEGQQILAGNWTPAIRLNSSSALTCTATMRAYVRSSGGVYTQIVSQTSGSIALTTLLATMSFSSVAGSLTNFGTGDKLYVDLWVDITLASTSTTCTIGVEESNGANGEFVTPGYQATPTPVTYDALVLAQAVMRANLW